jgi:carbamoyl-phosphate synthase large subunit
VNDADKAAAVPIARDFEELGFRLLATSGTRQYLLSQGIRSDLVFKVGEGRPNIVDHVKSGKVALLVNTPLGRLSKYDEKAIRRAATTYNVPCITTLSGAAASVNAIRSLQREKLTVRSLQEHHGVAQAKEFSRG